MTDRERLIEILSKPIYVHEYADVAVAVADYLLDNGVIVPPCKQRDTIYDISEFIDGTPAPEMYEIYVDCISLESDETGKTIFYIDGFEYYYEDFGKTVFLTREEAEKALAERSLNNE